MHSGKCDQSIIYRKTNTPGAATSGVFYTVWASGSNLRAAALFIFIQAFAEIAANDSSRGIDGK